MKTENFIKRTENKVLKEETFKEYKAKSLNCQVIQWLLTGIEFMHFHQLVESDKIEELNELLFRD